MKFAIMFLVILLLGIIGLGHSHEDVHVQIMKNYGIESRIEYFSHFPRFVTIHNEPCPTEECLKSHAMNEIIGYPLTIFYGVFGIGMFFLIALAEERNELKTKS